MFKRSIAVALVGACLAFGAHAEDRVYTYVEGGWNWLGDDEIDFDGPHGRFSLGIGPNFYIRGGYRDLESDSSPEVDAEDWELGGGIHFPIAQNVDVYGDATYGQFDFEVDRHDISGDTDYYTLGAGLKAWLARNLEGSAEFRYMDTDDIDVSAGNRRFIARGEDDWSLGGSLVGYFGQVRNLGVGVNYRYWTEEDTNEATVFVRWAFR